MPGQAVVLDDDRQDVAQHLLGQRLPGKRALAIHAECGRLELAEVLLQRFDRVLPVIGDLPALGILGTIGRDLDAEFVDVDAPVDREVVGDDLVVIDLFMADDGAQQAALDLDGRRRCTPGIGQHVALEGAHLHDDERPLALERVVAIPEGRPLGHDRQCSVLGLFPGQLPEIASFVGCDREIDWHYCSLTRTGRNQAAHHKGTKSPGTQNLRFS